MEKSRYIPTGEPHDAVSCVVCHVLDDENGAIVGSGPVNYDVMGSCRECHDRFCDHPTGVGFDWTDEESGEMYLPFLQDGEMKVVTCLTCHSFHGMKGRRYLLRKPGAIASKKRQALCLYCHTEGALKEMSPHTRDAGDCGICHRQPPLKGQQFTDADIYGFQRVCDFCHGLVADDHYRSIDPLADPEVSGGSGRLKLLSIRGEYACFSCHDPHDDSKRDQKLLKQEYLELAGRSRKINPHWKNVMCVTCHTGRPQKGEPRLRMEGDTIGLCVRCHNDEIASAFLHPVGCEPTSKVRIPENMPIEEGRVTCRTCHESSLQETGENLFVSLRTNSTFLRVGGYSPSDFCFKCHDRDIFSGINVHEQIDETGDVKKTMCAGCHFVLPEDDGDPTVTTGWETDPREYCILCHMRNSYLDRHPAGGPHLVVPPREIYYTLLSAEERIGASLPLFEGRITCSTCHDPHQRGVLEGYSSVDDRHGAKGVRAQYRELLCTGCHLDE